MFRVLCLLGFAWSVRSASAPFITPCKNGDSACLLSSAKAAMPYFISGVPELGIRPMDPMRIDLIKSEQGGLNLVFKDTVMTGLKSCVFQNIKMDAVKMKQSITVKCNLVLKGDYKLSGQLLILPVQGDGKYTIDIRDIVIKVSGELSNVTGPDGKTHWHIAKWKDSYNVLTGTTFAFQNLFNGNKILAAPVVEFANSNWKDVMQEIAPPIVKAIIAQIIDGVEALYKAVPAEELALA
ncbi:unnamed protein product [Leptosia nina]|uniref:Uncharacterized protein n=1 Tax=Leptosia nina TaxID=320188 RepID=A0AAV1JZX0_9NEOP